MPSRRDPGHFNCRDYVIAPESLSASSASNTIATSSHPTLWSTGRHESYDELELRARSPASFKPKFPLMKLPVELRQNIFRYILPRTVELGESTNPLTRHVQSSKVVQKRMGREMPCLPGSSPFSRGFTMNVTNICWHRGCTALMAVCRQMHDECADLIYGTNMFMFLISYEAISFRIRYSLPTGMARMSFKIMTDIPPRYRRLIRRLAVHVDHVDSYTGMVKFNVGGSGLTHGMRQQVQRFVTALRPPLEPTPTDENANDRPLTKVIIRVFNGSSLDALRSNRRVSGPQAGDGLEEMLYPFGQLHGVKDVSVQGDVTDEFKRELEEKISAPKSTSDESKWSMVKIEEDGLQGKASRVRLCVYGNDI